MTGRTIGRYQIEQVLGRGGMGIVYRAQDLQLNRPVAVKMLSQEVGDQERRRRFQQEAQAASALNHPHILTVFEAGTFEDQPYLVTEFVDGGTLRQWTRDQTPSPAQIVELLLTIADALACAHEAGILHRDVKPENILVARNGYAKLVDFGLAKLMERSAGDDAATMTEPGWGTRSGMILGTTAYMSPELAAGKPVDARSDVFAFGVVLYELLSGQRPFSGASDIDILHAIIHGSPKPLEESAAPAELRRAVEKALEKDPADRYQSMREMLVDLRRSQRVSSAQLPAPPPAKSRPRWWIGALAAVVVTAAGIAGWMVLNRPTGTTPLAGAQFTRLTDFEGVEADAAISHDGRLVAFLADRDGIPDVWITQLGTGEFTNLTKGRLGDVTQATRSVGFSGDGAFLWFRDYSESPIQLLPALGGNPRPLLRGVMAAWSPDGSRVAFHRGQPPGDPIFIADRNGNGERRIFVDPSADHCHYLAWSLDARWIYFSRGNPGTRDMDLWRIPAEGGQPERITRHGNDVAYPVPIDRRTVLYVTPADDGSGPWLYAVDVDTRVSRRISSGVEQYTSIAGNVSNGAATRLVATIANPVASLWSVPIGDRVADESTVRRVTVSTARALAPRCLPGGFVYLSSRGGSDGIWRWRDGTAAELWKQGAVREPAEVSPDGKRVAFIFRAKGRMAVHVMSSDGTSPQPVAEALDARGGVAWSPDGNWLAFGGEQGKQRGLFKVPSEGGPVVMLAGKPAFNPVWSPAGDLILYSDAPVGRTQDIRAVTPAGAPVSLPRPEFEPGEHDVPFREMRNYSERTAPELRVRMEGHRYRFLPGGKRIVLMQGQLRGQQFWIYDLASGRIRRITNLKPGYTMRSFDVSPDGKEILFDRIRENSDIVLIDLKR